ncbi:hypothetical protein [Shewanella frigidimarina]|uniref:hypothetical protein n=1 Tax=Shewanella frigidimarina TaxID=56812 RepID=UPI003D79D289
MLFAFAVSWRSPNIRWLMFSLILMKTLDVVCYGSIIQWGTGYYFTISVFDFFIIMLIMFRQNTARIIADLSIPGVSKFARESSEKYKLTANEVAVIIIFTCSIFVNFASIIERLIRHHTSLDPMFFYTAFPLLKFALSVLMLLVLLSVSINGARNLYKDID